MAESEHDFFHADARYAPVLLYWRIGNTIVQSSSLPPLDNSEKATIVTISSTLSREYGSHFSIRNLSRMVSFARSYPDYGNFGKLVDRLKWWHFVELSKIPEILLRKTYTMECANKGWSVRLLRRNIRLKKLHHRYTRAEAQAAAHSASTIQTAREVVDYPVWFGTNRGPNEDGTSFSNERHSRTTLGRVVVSIPKAHRFGETGSSIFRRMLRCDFNDDRLRVNEVQILKQGIFFTEINDFISKFRAAGEETHSLIFLHGYNVSFEEAAVRAAQIGYDLKVSGPTAFFSWPSRGTLKGYPADEATIDASEHAITEFLLDFTADCRAEKVHIIAHSMGNRGLLRALQRITASAEPKIKVKFGQIFLAAPDVDRDLFLELASLYPEHSERTTLYASKRDLPVYLSTLFHGAPRAGYYTPYTVTRGVDTVAVPNFNIDLLGHAYFAQAEALLHDIYDLILYGKAPERRQRIIPASYEGTNFWQLLR